jgi:DNA-binding NtrC family response regulator
LRERRDDILPLAESFLKKISNRISKSAPSISPEAGELLRHYDWPGNVRKPANAMERALIISQAGSIEADDLPMKHEPEKANLERPGLLAQVERTTVIESISRNKGDRRAAAEELESVCARFSIDSKSMELAAGTDITNTFY